MKKFRKIAYIVLIIIIVILSFTIYTSASKNNDADSQDKIVSEIKYIESKLIDLLNSINNIESRNYNISVSEMSKKTTEETTGGSSSSSSGSESSSGGGSSGGGESSSGGGGSQSGGSSEGTSSSQESEKDKKKYEMKLSGVLTNTEDINWDFIKSEVEIMYTSIPTITMDLYKLDLNQEDILNFNKEYDTLAVAVKEEKKEDTLTQLSKLYEYMPKFLKNTSGDEVFKKIVETKAYIFGAYAKLDAKDWNKIENDINKAIEVYSQLLSNTNVDNNKQYSISKGYIMLNELQNAVKIKDTEIFLIKYKNIIEDFNCM